MKKEPTGWALDCPELASLLRDNGFSGIEDGIRKDEREKRIAQNGFYIVYALCLNGLAYYFGISRRASSRFHSHFRGKSDNPDLAAWLFAHSGDLEIVVIHREEYTGTYAQKTRIDAIEKCLAARGRDSGRTYNLADGGGASSEFAQKDPEGKRRAISESMRGVRKADGSVEVNIRPDPPAVAKDVRDRPLTRKERSEINKREWRKMREGKPFRRSWN